MKPTLCYDVNGNICNISAIHEEDKTIMYFPFDGGTPVGVSFYIMKQRQDKWGDPHESNKLPRRPQKVSPVKVTEPDLPNPNVVTKPSHYQFFDGVEAIEIIASSMSKEGFHGYCMGNRLKYRLRAGNKDKLEQDIAKSDYYLKLYETHKHLCRS